MTNRSRKSAGYTLTELLTIVAIVGLTTMVSIPAIMQLVPQYRIRAAAAEMSNALKMTRQKAVATRRPWRMTFDTTNERYAISVLSGTDVRTPGHWTPVDNRWMEVTAVRWQTPIGSDLRNGPNAFYDVDCADGKDIIFMANGSIFRGGNGGCGGGADVFAAGRPELVVAVDNRFVRFNRYRILANPAGNLNIISEKQ